MAMELGVLINIYPEQSIEAQFRQAVDMELRHCQLCTHDVTWLTDDIARHILAAQDKTGMTITALWCGWSGPAKWDFIDGPATLGLVPVAFRYARMQELLRGADFAQKLGVTDVITHAGFIPENLNDPLYADFIAAMRWLCSEFARRGCCFLFETGQETPVTLLRAIQDIGTDNLGINLDTANLILYGKANTLDALDVFGAYVRNTHIKDGLYPSDGRKLGRETAFGAGKANFPALLARLKELGYQGPLIIEREITGPQQTADIQRARDALRGLLA